MSTRARTLSRRGPRKITSNSLTTQTPGWVAMRPWIRRIIGQPIGYPTKWDLPAPTDLNRALGKGDVLAQVASTGFITG